MGSDLFRIIVDEPNYSATLGDQADAAVFADANLSELRGSRLWAQRNSENGQQVYDSLKPGDGLFFYKLKRNANDGGRYVGIGRVGEKRRLTVTQAELLFQTSVARLAYTVTEFEPISKSIEDVERLLGYGSYPQSSHRVTNDRYTTVDEALHSLTR